MEEEPRFYDPKAVAGMSEDQRRAEVDTLAKEIHRYELVIVGLRKRRMSLMSYNELWGKDSAPLESTMTPDDDASERIRNQVRSLLSLADDMLSVGLNRSSDKIRQSCALILENLNRLPCEKSDT
jgi:hypothetical protein